VGYSNEEIRPPRQSIREGVYIEVSPRARPPHGTFTPLFFSRIEKRVSIIIFSPLFLPLFIIFPFFYQKITVVPSGLAWGHFLTGHIPPLTPIGPHLPA